MIEKFEAGKRYIWTGPKTDPNSWLPGLDGEPHTCVFASKDGRHARFAGQRSGPLIAYYYGDVLDRISEVPAQRECMPIGTPVRLTAEGREQYGLRNMKAGIGTIYAVDHPDPIRPYRVRFTEGGLRWCSAADIERIPDDTTPKVCDLHLMLAGSAPFVDYLGHIDPSRISATRQERRREIRRKLLGL